MDIQPSLENWLHGIHSSSSRSLFSTSTPEEDEEEALPPNRPINTITHRSATENGTGNGNGIRHSHRGGNLNAQRRQHRVPSPPLTVQRPPIHTEAEVPEPVLERLWNRRPGPQPRARIEAMGGVPVPAFQSVAERIAAVVEDEDEEESHPPAPNRLRNLLSRSKTLFFKKRDIGTDEPLPLPASREYIHYSRPIDELDLFGQVEPRRLFPGERFTRIQIDPDGWYRPLPVPVGQRRLRPGHRQLRHLPEVAEPPVFEEEEVVDEEDEEWEDDWRTEILDEVPEDLVGFDDLSPPVYEEVEVGLPAYAAPVEVEERLVQAQIPNLSNFNPVRVPCIRRQATPPPPSYEAIAWEGKKRCGCCCRAWGKFKNWFRIREDVVEERREIAVREFSWF